MSSFRKTHCGSAQNDDALLMEPDDPLIRAEIEQRGEVQVLQIHRLGVRQSFHISLWVHSIDSEETSPRSMRPANA
jgi:hypothetical protein